MAINPNLMAGLFQGPTQNEVATRLGKEREARILQAMAANQAAGGNYYSNLQAKANALLGEGVRGIGEAVTGYEHPDLAAARKRATDKSEILAMLDTDGDGTLSAEEMRLGHGELLKRGYAEEAQQFLAAAQSMVDQQLKERGVVVQEKGQEATQASLEAQTYIATERLGLDQTKQKFFERQDVARLNIEEQTALWDREHKRLLRGLTARGYDIQESRNTDLRIASERDSKLARELGIGNLEVARDNTKIKQFVADTNKAYGLESLRLQEQGQEATIRQADAALALKETLGLRAADVADANVSVAERNATVNEDRAKLEEYLGKGKFDYDRMSTDRLYKLAVEKQMFDQELALRGMTVEESLAGHRILMDGKEFDWRVVSEEARMQLAQEEFKFSQEMGYADKSLEERRLILMDKAQEHNISLDLRKQGFTEESFKIQEDRLQKVMALEEEWADRNFSHQQKMDEVNVLLKREGLFNERMSNDQRYELAAERLAMDKMLGVHGMEMSEKKLKLQEDIAADNKWLGVNQLQLDRMKINDLKNYRLAQLKSQESIAEMQDLTKRYGFELGYAVDVAGAGALDPTVSKTVNDNDILEMTSVLNANPDFAEAVGESGWTNLGMFQGSDRDAITALASEYQAFKAKNKGWGMTEFMNFKMGKTGGSGGNKYDTVTADD